MPQHSYIGLRPYTEADATRFIGRDDETHRLSSLVFQHNVTFLGGPSGIGKTSLIHAGLIPMLRARKPRLTIVVGRVAAHPIAELAACIDPEAPPPADDVAFAKFLKLRTNADTLLVLDEYEEMLALASPIERRKFENGLIASLQDGAPRLLVSLRSDYVGQALEGFASNDQYPPVFFLGPLTRDAVERLINQYASDQSESVASSYKLLRDIGTQPNTAVIQAALSTFQTYGRSFTEHVSLEKTIRAWFERVWVRTQVDRLPVARILRRFTTPNGFRVSLSISGLPAPESAALRELINAGIITVRADHSGVAVAELTHDLLVPVILEFVAAETEPPAAEPERPRSTPRAEVFISYAHEDASSALVIYEHLKKRGFRPWIDKYDIPAGKDWAYEISRALERADFIIICLSAMAYHKRGYVQREIRVALDRCTEIPPGEAFVFPVRIDECSVPPEIAKYQYVNLFAPEGLPFLLESIEREWNSRSADRGA